jgi:hypothetical protein
VDKGLPVFLSLAILVAESGILLAQVHVLIAGLSARVLELDDDRLETGDWEEWSETGDGDGTRGIPVSSRVEM